MRLLTEYLSTKISSNILNTKFPDKFDENLDNVVEFLKSQNFDELQKTIDGSFCLKNALELFDDIKTNSYLRYKVKTGTILSFSNGGKISEENPLFSIYKSKHSSIYNDTYDEHFGLDKEGTYFTKRYKNSREFSNRINKYFNWE